jgi:hypothetical protein
MGVNGKMALITAKEARELTDSYLSEQVEKELNRISDQIRTSAEKGFNHLPRKTFNGFSKEDINRIVTTLEANDFRVDYKEGDTYGGYGISW